MKSSLSSLLFTSLLLIRSGVTSFRSTCPFGSSSIIRANHHCSNSLSTSCHLVKKPTKLPLALKDENEESSVSRNALGEKLGNSWTKIQSITKQQAEKLAQAGRGGFLAYGFLNFALYAGGTVWQWRSFQGSGLPKLAKVLGSVYIGSQVTKLLRIALAVALAPAGNRSLLWIKTKLKISEGQAFALLTTSLIVSFVGVLAFLTIGSKVIS